MSMQPDIHESELICLAPAPLSDVLLHKGLVQKLNSIGLELTSDLWVLALGERVSLRPEFSTLIHQVLRKLAEQQYYEQNAQYETTISLLSEDRIENNNTSMHAFLSGDPLDDLSAKVGLQMRVADKRLICWEAKLKDSRLLKEILINQLDNAECRDFCLRLIDKARNETIKVVNWVDPPNPPINRWEDLLAEPASELFSSWLLSMKKGEGWLRSTKRSERNLLIFQERLGLLSGQRKILEEVGQEFGITRERIRQIVHGFLSALCHPARRKLMLPFQVRLISLFREQAGIMTLKEVADGLDFPANVGGFSRLPAVELLLYCCRGEFCALDYDYERGGGSTEISDVTWHVKTIKPISIRKSRIFADALIDKNPCSYDFDDLARAVCKKSGKADPAIIRASLRTYKLIEADPSGLMVRTGKSLSVTSLARIALKEIGVPAHVTIITEKINELFPGRALKPGHVNIHLINPLFRWVDRGTYGLAEWGLPDIRPKVRYSAGKKVLMRTLEHLGKPTTIREIEDYLDNALNFDFSLKYLSRPSIILQSNPKLFVSLGEGKWALAKWNLAPKSIKDTISLACEVLTEDMGAWLSIQQLYMEMKSRGWPRLITSLQRALDWELGKPRRRIRREELHGFNIFLYGLANRDWNEQIALAKLLAD
jgi:hypothetical protein